MIVFQLLSWLCGLAETSWLLMDQFYEGATKVSPFPRWEKWGRMIRWYRHYSKNGYSFRTNVCMTTSHLKWYSKEHGVRREGPCLWEAWESTSCGSSPTALGVSAVEAESRNPPVWLRTPYHIIPLSVDIYSNCQDRTGLLKRHSQSTHQRTWTAGQGSLVASHFLGK